jgi:hypothetical protein
VSRDCIDLDRGLACAVYQGKTSKMLRVGMPYVVSLLGLALIACSSQPLPNIATARSTMSGMNPGQITACMGRPGTVLTQNSTTVWSYNTLNGSSNAPPILTDPVSLSAPNAPLSAGPQSSGSFAAAMASPPRAACTVTIIFNNGQVDGVNFLGPNGAQLSQSDGCGQMVQQCIPVAGSGVHVP